MSLNDMAQSHQNLAMEATRLNHRDQSKTLTAPEDRPLCHRGSCNGMIMHRNGTFRRNTSRDDAQRFRCPRCKAGVSTATFSTTWRQKKPCINGTLLGLFTAKVTMRRSAMLLGVNRITVRRKLIHLGKIARAQDQIPSSLKCKHFIFDEVITKETSKFLPLAIPLLVAHPSRVIMDFDVAAMTAQERFRAEGEARYGTRIDQREQKIEAMLTRARIQMLPQPVILTDKDPLYATLVERVVPGSMHVRIKSRRAHSTGQGELKKGGYDPFFSLNHSAAMMRDSVSRMVRKTWAITRCPERLRDHIDIYKWFHNAVLIEPKPEQHRLWRTLAEFVSGGSGDVPPNQVFQLIKMAPKQREYAKRERRGLRHSDSRRSQPEEHCPGDVFPPS